MPKITPSGFNIGIILKMYALRKNSASGLDGSVKKSKIPSNIYEDGVSPGCYRAVIIIYFLLSLLVSIFDVIVNNSQLFFAIV